MVSALTYRPACVAASSRWSDSCERWILLLVDVSVRFGDRGCYLRIRRGGLLRYVHRAPLAMTLREERVPVEQANASAIIEE